MRLFRPMALVSLIAALGAVSVPARAAPSAAAPTAAKALPASLGVAVAPHAVTLTPTMPLLADRFASETVLLLPTMTVLSVVPALRAPATRDTGRCTPVAPALACADDGLDVRRRL